MSRHMVPVVILIKSARRETNPGVRWRLQEADTARVRAARRAALCGVAASLVKQQGYMLAQIVTEINAPDLAAGDVGGAGCSGGGCGG